MDTTDASGLDGADMQRLAGGHDAALNDLMARHARPVFQFLCRMLGNEDDANDLAQETFVRVYQHRASFKPGARFTTWLYTIAAKKQELQAALDNAQGMTPEAAQKLTEVAALRAQCQANMLAHFYEVSRAMPSEQGHRYLAEMQRLTLGFHEQIENTMSPDSSSHHGHH